MALTSHIRAYDEAWPGMYAAEIARLKPIFGKMLRAIHHIGSTAVPGLAAKPEIDILAVVVEVSKLPAHWRAMFGALGYRQGGDLSPGHRFFERDVAGVRTHKVHVCDEGHDSVNRMLKFRDHLRSNAEHRLQYQELKLRLERENTDGIGQYLTAKAPFIEAIMARVNE